MYCTNCGQPRPPNANFCPYCGLRLSPTGTGHFVDSPGLRPSATKASVGGRLPLVPWQGGQVALGILLVLLSVVPVALLATGLGRLAGGYDDAVAAWTTSHLLGLSILAVVWMLGLRRYGVALSSLGLGQPRLPRITSVLLTVGVLVASLVANFLYFALVDQTGIDLPSPPDDPDIVFPGPAALVTYQALALWTPFTEEIFFRGFIFAGLAPRLGVRLAMVASALIFSGFHIFPGVMVPIFITGLLLPWLYHRTGSLWPSIVAHAGQNSLVLLAIIYGG